MIADSTGIRAESHGMLAERRASTGRGPLARGSKERLATAALLNEVLSNRARHESDNCSTRAVALRCKANPRVIHEYRHGEKLVPWALAWVLPLDVVDEINETIMSKRGGGRSWRWALSLIERGVDWLEERGVRADDRDEASVALLALQGRLVKAIARVNQPEGK